MRIKAELATGMDSPKPLASRLMRIGILFIVEVAALAAEPGTPSVPCAAELTLPDDVIAARLMSRNSERAQKLRHVDSIRQYNLDYTGLSSALGAQMQVNASYTAPGTKEFSVISESGSNLMRKRVLHKLLEAEQEAASDAANREAVQLSTTNYRFFLLGCESSGTTHPLYVVRVEPLRESKVLYRGTIWIDSQDFAVTRIEAEPAKSPRSGQSAHKSIINTKRSVTSTCLRSTRQFRMCGQAVEQCSPSGISITNCDNRWRVLQKIAHRRIT